MPTVCQWIWDYLCNLYYDIRIWVLRNWFPRYLERRRRQVRTKVRWGRLTRRLRSSFRRSVLFCSAASIGSPTKPTSTTTPLFPYTWKFPDTIRERLALASPHPASRRLHCLACLLHLCWVWAVSATGQQFPKPNLPQPCTRVLQIHP